MILSLVLGLGFVFNCRQAEESAPEAAENIEVEKAAVRNIVHRYIEALENRSMEDLAGIFAQDDDTVLLDGNDSRRFVGWEAIETRYREHFSFYERLEVKIRDLRIQVHSSGEVSWLACVLDWDYVFQGRAVAARGLRASWVLRKRNGDWRLVQAHFSFAKVPEERK